MIFPSLHLFVTFFQIFQIQLLFVFQFHLQLAQQLLPIINIENL